MVKDRTKLKRCGIRKLPKKKEKKEYKYTVCLNNIQVELPAINGFTIMKVSVPHSPWNWVDISKHDTKRALTLRPTLCRQMLP